MLYSATAVAVAVLGVPALALGSSASASPSSTVHATVDKANRHGEKISLTQDGAAAGHLELKLCANTSATAVTCSGTGTVQGLGPGKVRLHWHCPVGRPCEGHGEGTLKHKGSLLALLHVKATVVKVESAGATFRIGVELVGE
jgi:hypothetical protein